MHDVLLFATGASFGFALTAGSLAYRVLTATQAAAKAGR